MNIIDKHSYIGLIFLIFLSAHLHSQTYDSLKIMTFNIYGAPESDWEIRKEMLLNLLAEEQPDLIAFQEVIDPANDGSQPRIKELAEILFERTEIGYQYRYEYTHFSWSIWNEGIGILSKYNILETEGHLLPAGLFQRKILRCKVATPAGFINFYSTHLSFGNQENVRILQVEEIKNYIASNIIDSTAVMNVVCGDFNAVPDSPPIQMMTQPDNNGVVYLDSWAETYPGEDGFTMPSDNPDARIDYIFVRNQQWGKINDARLVLDSPNEDEIYTSDHIGVIGELETTNPKSEVTIISPLAGSEVSGEVNIQWDIFPTIESDTAIIFISNDNGQSWSEEWRGLTESNSYLWNTLNIDDGTQYRLRLIFFRDSLYGFYQLDSSITINNPGNAVPEINLIDPAGGEEIQGVYYIRWNAQDADGDLLNIDLDMSVDGGISWNELAWDLENNGIYNWDTRNFSNGNRYRIRLRCNDGTVEVEDVSYNFSVANEHPPLADSLFIHVSGYGSGALHAHIVNENELTDHLYSISFDDTSFSNTVYNIYDNQTESFVVENAEHLDGHTEGPYFDGIRLTVYDYKQTKVNFEESGWTAGSSLLDYSIYLPVVSIGGEIIEGYPYPADYKIYFYDHVADTSSNFLNAPVSPMKFAVYNTTENHQVDVLFIDINSDSTLGRFEDLYILENDLMGQPMLTWTISYSAINPVDPAGPGDEFSLMTFKPFTIQDVFHFSPDPDVLDIETTNGIILKYKLSQNYPNPFNPVTFIAFNIPKSEKVKIEIYNMLGQKIYTLLNRNLKSGNHIIKFTGHNLASGIYFYRIKAGKFQDTKKMLYIK